MGGSSRRSWPRAPRVRQGTSSTRRRTGREYRPDGSPSPPGARRSRAGGGPGRPPGGSATGSARRPSCAVRGRGERRALRTPCRRRQRGTARRPCRRSGRPAPRATTATGASAPGPSGPGFGRRRAPGCRPEDRRARRRGRARRWHGRSDASPARPSRRRRRSSRRHASPVPAAGVRGPMPPRGTRGRRAAHEFAAPGHPGGGAPGGRPRVDVNPRGPRCPAPHRGRRASRGRTSLRGDLLGPLGERPQCARSDLLRPDQRLVVVAADERFDAVERDVVVELLRRALHEVGRWRDERPFEAPVQAQLQAADRVGDDTGAVRAVPELELGAERHVAVRRAFHLDVAELAVRQPWNVVARTDVDVARLQLIVEHRRDRVRLADLLALETFPLGHVEEVGVAAEVQLVRAVEADAAIHEEAGHHAMRDGRADLALDVVADDRKAFRGEPALPVGLAADEDRDRVDEADAGLQGLLGVPLGRLLAPDREIGDHHVDLALLEDPDDVGRGAGGLLDDRAEVLAQAVVGHAPVNADPDVRDLLEDDRVVRVRVDRLGEVLADLRPVDVERSHELDVADVVPAEAHVHEPGDEVPLLGVLVVVAALDQAARTVADADDRDADLAVLALCPGPGAGRVRVGSVVAHAVRAPLLRVLLRHLNLCCLLWMGGDGRWVGGFDVLLGRSEAYLDACERTWRTRWMTVIVEPSVMIARAPARSAEPGASRAAAAPPARPAAHSPSVRTTRRTSRGMSPIDAMPVPVVKPSPSDLARAQLTRNAEAIAAAASHAPSWKSARVLPM